MKNAILALQDGDMTMRIETGTTPLDVHATDEFGQAAHVFNGFLEDFKGMIDAFRKSTGLAREIW